MDGFDRFCIVLMFLCVMGLSVGATIMTAGLQDRVKVLEQAAEAKP